jgi:hypothetical protein
LHPQLPPTQAFPFELPPQSTHWPLVPHALSSLPDEQVSSAPQQPDEHATPP